MNGSDAPSLSRTDLAAAVHRVSNLRGEFVLRSGAVSNEYFDKYLFEAVPALLREIALHLAPLVPAGTDALAGLETGGIPIATLLSQVTGLPTRFVRKQAKEYGTRRLAEGGRIDGVRLLVVEDVVTSGGQVAISSRQLREFGATVETAVCVIDRQAGGRERLAEAGIELASLFTMEELKAAVAS